MTLMTQLTPGEIRDLLTKSWMTHDAMWFAQTLFSEGIDPANRLNRSAIKAMAGIEVKRLLRMQGLCPDEVQGFEGFRTFFCGIQDLVIPEFMNVTVGFEAPDTITWQSNLRGCFAYKGIKRLKVEKRYQCGVLYRIQCWLDCLNIAFDMTPVPATCLMNALGNCRGKFVCRFTAP